MKRDELEAKLSERGVHETLFSLNGLVKRSECYCAVQEDGTWKVIYIERGQALEIGRGLSQNDAYDLIYNEFKTAYGWQKCGDTGVLNS